MEAKEQKTLTNCQAKVRRCFPDGKCVTTECRRQGILDPKTNTRLCKPHKNEKVEKFPDEAKRAIFPPSSDEKEWQMFLDEARQQINLLASEGEAFKDILEAEEKQCEEELDNAKELLEEQKDIYTNLKARRLALKGKPDPKIASLENEIRELTENVRLQEMELGQCRQKRQDLDKMISQFKQAATKKEAERKSFISRIFGT